MLHIKNLTIKYHDQEVVKNVSLSVSPGEIVGIVGESGSGKSTLLRSILKLLGNGGRIISGSIEFRGRELNALAFKELRTIRGKEIALIYQHPALSFDPTVRLEKQFYEAGKVHGMGDKSQVRRRAELLLEQMKFDDPERILASYPFELSGGMCQRAAIAMAMLHEPALLLADEPTSALDVTVQAQVVETMMDLRKQTGTAILIVTHNMGVAAHMSDQIGVMNKGKLEEFGLTDKILYKPEKDYTKKLIAAIPKMDGSLPGGITDGYQYT